MGLGGLVGGILGGGPKDNSGAIIAAQNEAKMKADAEAKAAQDAKDQAGLTEEERRKRILALNQGGNTGQLTPSGGDQTDAATGRKKLLGL